MTVDESATPDEPGDTPGEEPVDPSLQQLASLEDLYDLPDGTTFQCSAEVYVNYQNGQYLYIQQLSEEGDAPLVYASGGDDEAETNDALIRRWEELDISAKAETLEITALDRQTFRRKYREYLRG